MNKLKLKVHNQVILAISNVKYLGVYLDQNLNYQIEIKNILRKMALRINSLCSVRDIFPKKNRKLLLNALVVSHLHYSAIFLSGISENLLTTLEEQLNWGIKACFNRLNYDHSSDLKIQHNILPVRSLPNQNCQLLLEMEKQKTSGFCFENEISYRSHKISQTNPERLLQHPMQN